MKKIGLIGGMSWESTQIYYRIFNQRVKEILGGYHSARCLIESVDFANIQQLQHQENWPELDQMMIQCAQNLEKAGAEIIILGTNTMHLCSPAIIANIQIPFLHIADATGRAIQERSIKKVLLLGTQFTMEKDFYHQILRQTYALDSLIPGPSDRQVIHRIIYEELVHGQLQENSKKAILQIIQKAIESGAEGVILGCTEIPLLIHANDINVPLFDTTQIHATAAIDMALS